MPQPLPYGGTALIPGDLYPEDQNHRKAIERACAEARAQNKGVMVVWGTNVCGMCYMLADVLENEPEISRLIQTDYLVVKVPLGTNRMDENTDVALDAGVDVRSARIPSISFLDTGSGRAKQTLGIDDIKAQHLSQARPFKNDVILGALLEHAPVYPDAENVLESRKKTAQRTGKHVLLMFTSPWCDGCGAARELLSRGSAARVLFRQYVRTEIDAERSLGGGAMLASLGGTMAEGESPFFVILDQEGRKVHPEASGRIDLTRQGGMDAFLRAVERTQTKLTGEQLASLRESVRQAVRANLEQRDNASAETSDPKDS